MRAVAALAARNYFTVGHGIPDQDMTPGSRAIVNICHPREADPELAGGNRSAMRFGLPASRPSISLGEDLSSLPETSSSCWGKVVKCASPWPQEGSAWESARETLALRAKAAIGLR